MEWKFFESDWIGLDWIGIVISFGISFGARVGNVLC